MKTDALLVPKNEIDTVWNMVSGFVDAALNHSQGELDTVDVHELLRLGVMHLWIVVDHLSDEKSVIVAALVAEFVDYPRKRVCKVVALGGIRMSLWLHHIKSVEEWAVDYDCSRMDTMCRPGFARAITSQGYSRDYIHMGKAL